MMFFSSVKCSNVLNATVCMLLCITLSLLPLWHTEDCLLVAGCLPSIYYQCYVTLSNILNCLSIHGWIMVTTKALLVASGGTIFFTVTVTALVAFVPRWTKAGIISVGIELQCFSVLLKWYFIGIPNNVLFNIRY